MRLVISVSVRPGHAGVADVGLAALCRDKGVTVVTGRAEAHARLECDLNQPVQRNGGNYFEPEILAIAAVVHPVTGL